MKRIWVFSLLTLVFLAGCVFQAGFDPKDAAELDRSLLGTWQWIPPEDEQGEEKNLVLIHEGGEKEYAVTYVSGSTALLFRAYAVDVEGVKIMNLQWLNKTPKDREFVFYKFEMKDGVLEIKHLNTDVINKDTATTEELREAVKKNIANPDLFVEPARFKKVG